jgi:hypothetical protein
MSKTSYFQPLFFEKIFVTNMGFVRGNVCEDVLYAVTSSAYSTSFSIATRPK